VERHPVNDPIDVPVRDEGIRLGQFLKLANAVDQGSDVKWLLSAGEVTVNGELEVRRGRQLVDGDVVEHAGTTYRVTAG
jgi:ribosome-associated protein